MRKNAKTRRGRNAYVDVVDSRECGRPVRAIRSTAMMTRGTIPSRGSKMFEPRIIHQSGHLSFWLMAKRGKSRDVQVRGKKNDILGWIKWYKPWRQHVFFMRPDTIWSWDCLFEVMEIMKSADEGRIP